MTRTEKIAVEKYHPCLQNESFRSYVDESGLKLVQPKRIKSPLLVLGAQNDTVITPELVQDAA